MYAFLCFVISLCVLSSVLAFGMFFFIYVCLGFFRSLFMVYVWLVLSLVRYVLLFLSFCLFICLVIS